GVMSILCTRLTLQMVIDALLATRIVMQFMAQIGALVWLRKRAPEMKRPFRVWLYPLPIIVALVGWLFLLSTIGKTLIYGGLMVLAGCVVFFSIGRRPQASHESG